MKLKNPEADSLFEAFGIQPNVFLATLYGLLLHNTFDKNGRDSTMIETISNCEEYPTEEEKLLAVLMMSRESENIERLGTIFMKLYVTVRAYQAGIPPDLYFVNHVEPNRGPSEDLQQFVDEAYNEIMRPVIATLNEDHRMSLGRSVRALVKNFEARNVGVKIASEGFENVF